MARKQRAIYAHEGDVFFTRSNSMLGRLIRWAETDPDEEGTNGAWANHTGVVVQDGWIVPPSDDAPHQVALAVVVEALWKTKKWEWWKAHRAQVMDGQRIKVFGPREPRTKWEKVCFQNAAAEYVGDTYGWWKLGAHLLDRVLFKGKKTLSKLLRIDNRPICSYLAAKCQAAQGMTFGMEPQAADPDEMLDFCESPKGRILWIER